MLFAIKGFDWTNFVAFTILSSFLLSTSEARKVYLNMIAKIFLFSTLLATVLAGGAPIYGAAPLGYAAAPALTYAAAPALTYAAAPALTYAAAPAVTYAAAAPVAIPAPIAYATPAKVIYTHEPVEQHGYKIAY